VLGRMAKLPRSLLWIDIVKIGEERVIVEVPPSAGIVRHAIVFSTDVLLLIPALL
jgi:hypothetical protein